MPQPKVPSSLVNLSMGVTSDLVYRGLFQIDSMPWTEPVSQRSPQLSPINCCFHVRSDGPSSPAVNSTLQYSPEATELRNGLRNWLIEIPKHLLEKLVEEVIQNIWKNAKVDRDHKLVKTIINIQHSKLSDFSFGLHSFLLVLANTGISKLPFTENLWSCIADYELIGSTKFMDRALMDTLAHYHQLTFINLSFVATDGILFLISQHCIHLEELYLDHSLVSDRGTRFLSGWSENVRKALFQETQTEAKPEEPDCSVPQRSLGCRNLKILSLDHCSAVTEHAIWYLLQHNPALQQLTYHKNYSVAEILCDHFSLGCDVIKKFPIQRMRLAAFEHPFPYGLAVPEEIMDKILHHCPHIVKLNVVSTNDGLVSYVKMQSLKFVMLEFEDYVGLNFHKFLSSNIGQNLSQLTLTYSSDVEIEIGAPAGQGHQLINVGLKMAKIYCPNLEKLYIFGSSLVTNDLMDLVNTEWDKNLPGLKYLRHLILMTYDNTVNACDDKVLLKFLKDCDALEFLSFEGNFSFIGDTFLSTLMRSNPLKSLKMIDIRGSKVPLTISSLRCCLTLENIHEIRLSKWEVTDEEFKAVEQEVKLKGLDVNLMRSKNLPENEENPDV